MYKYENPFQQCWNSWWQKNYTPEKNHAHSGNGGRAGAAEVVRLKEEVHIGPELDTLTTGHGKQTIVVQDRVERFDPLGIDVPVTDDPRLDVDGLSHHLPSTVRQHAVRPFTGVHVDVTKQLRQLEQRCLG